MYFELSYDFDYPLAQICGDSLWKCYVMHVLADLIDYSGIALLKITIFNSLTVIPL